MVKIESHIYQCGQQELNAGRWWTVPLLPKKNSRTVVVCGGNVVNEAGVGVGTNNCLSVNLKSCQVKQLSGTMSTTRQDVRPVCLTPGQCYLFGGNTVDSNPTAMNIDRVDLQTKTIQTGALQPLSEPRLCYVSTRLSETDFLISGGYGLKDPTTQRGIPYNTVVRVNVATNQQTVLIMTQQRSGHSVTALPDGTFLVLGGGDTDPKGGEIYNPQNNSFTPLQDKMSSPRKDHRVVVAKDKKAYIMGGTATEDSPMSIEVYDPETQQFSDTGMKIFEGREDAAIVYVEAFNIIVLVGGQIKIGKEKPPSSAIDVIDLNARQVYHGQLQSPHDEAAVVVREVNVAEKTVRLLALLGENKVDGKEVSVPAEEIVISLPN